MSNISELYIVEGNSWQELTELAISGIIQNILNNLFLKDRNHSEDHT